MKRKQEKFKIELFIGLCKINHAVEMNLPATITDKLQVSGPFSRH